MQLVVQLVSITKIIQIKGHYYLNIKDHLEKRLKTFSGSLKCLEQMVIMQWSFKVLNSQFAIHFHASVVLLCMSWKVQYKLYVLGPFSCKHQHTLKMNL